MMALIEQEQTGLRLYIYLQPRASRDQWQGEHDGELKLAITAPPVDGAANQYLCKFLAKQFGVAKRQVVLEKGLTSRHKCVYIEAPAKYPAALGPWLGNEASQ